MNRKNDESSKFKSIVKEYEVMSREGTVGLLKETVFFDLIDYYRNGISVFKALDVVGHALMQYPSSSDFYFIKANLLLDIEKNEEAINCLEMAKVLAPGDMDIKILLMSLINEQSSLNDVEDSVSSKLFDGAGLFDANQLEAKLSQMEQKIYMFQDILDDDPTNDDALVQLLQCIDFTKEYKKGVRIFNDVIDRHPFSSTAWFNLGYVYQEIGNIGLAIEAYEYSFLIDKKFTPAYECFADLNVQQGNYKRALSAFEDLLSTNIKPTAGLLTQIGHCYELKGDLEFAQAFYVKAFDLDVKFDYSYYRLGECLMKQGRPKQAIGSYLTAIEINEFETDYHLGLADAFLEVGENERAINYLESAVGAAPDEPMVWVKYIAVLLLLERNSEAMELSIESLQYSDDILIKYTYAACLFRIGNNQEAMVKLVDCLSTQIDDHKIIFDLSPELEENSLVTELIEMYV